MKKNMFLAASLLFSTAIFVGCTNEESIEQVSDNMLVVEAGYGLNSRTSLAENSINVLWSENDMIYLFGGESSSKMKLVEGIGEGLGVFRGSLHGSIDEITHAIYPYVEPDDDGSFCINMPDEREYSENSGAPLWGTYDLNKRFVKFENLTAMVRVPLYGLEGGEEFSLELDKAIAGIMKIKDGNLTIEGTKNSVKVTNLPVGDCYVDIPVPAQTYNTMKIMIDNVLYAERTSSIVLDADDVVIINQASEPDTPEVGDAYEIENVAELFWLAEEVNKGTNFEGETVKLIADINLANAAWTPIGNGTNKFKGTFDGNGFTISNLSVNTNASDQAAGLFGVLNGTVKNLIIDGAYVEAVTSGNNGAAVVAGTIHNTGLIEDVTVKNAEVRGNHYLGGIVGYTYGSIKNCKAELIKLIATANKSGSSYDNGDKVGGIAGFLASDAPSEEISGNTVNDIEIKGYRDLGGIIGYAGSTVKDNTADDITITVDTRYNYNNYSYPLDFNADGVIGRPYGGTHSNNTATNVTINIPVAKLNGVEYASLEAVLNAAKNEGECVITLEGDFYWETGAAHSSTPLIPSDVTNNQVTIDGQGIATLTATGSGVGPLRHADGGKLIFKNLNVIDESISYNEGAWELTYLEFAGNLEFVNCTFNSGIQIQAEGEEDINVSFTNCNFISNESSVYSVWLSDGTVLFEKCTFTGTRGLKIHEAYGSDITQVLVNNCIFKDLTKKPGIAIGDVNESTVIKIANSQFLNCQAGDQNLYIYETDTDVDAFNFILNNNTVN